MIWPAISRATQAAKRWRMRAVARARSMELDAASFSAMVLITRSAEAWMYPYVSKMNGVKLSFFQKRFNKVYFLLTLLIHSNHSRC